MCVIHCVLLCVIDANIKDKFHDPDNEDFRPLTSSITVGPYPYNPTSSTYWIPGRQLNKASSPVPPHRATRVTAAHRDALMWLNGYGCDTHDVYLGTKSGSVARADRESEEFVGTVTGGNVVYLEKRVVVGVKYYWRVDVVCGGEDSSPGKGDIWNFTTV